MAVKDSLARSSALILRSRSTLRVAACPAALRGPRRRLTAAAGLTPPTAPSAAGGCIRVARRHSGSVTKFFLPVDNHLIPSLHTTRQNHLRIFGQVDLHGLRFHVERSCIRATLPSSLSSARPACGGSGSRFTASACSATSARTPGTTPACGSGSITRVTIGRRRLPWLHQEYEATLCT